MPMAVSTIGLLALKRGDFFLSVSKVSGKKHKEIGNVDEEKS